MRKLNIKSFPRLNQFYGWIPDIPDKRDYKFTIPLGITDIMPPSIDLRDKCPKIYDQGALGTCGPNAIGAAHQFDQMKQQKGLIIQPSRLFIYWNTREIEGTLNSDSGIMIRDGIKSIVNLGICDEKKWPYNIKKFRNKPTPRCYKEGLCNQALTYYSVFRILKQMKGCLASGYPFVFGFSVYEGFESSEVSRTGIANMPLRDERMLGGHAVMCVGYDDATQRFLVRNSWGNRWGNKGYFTLPYDYLMDEDLSSDFWTVRLVE